MGSRIYLSADVSDVAGYRTAYVGMRKPDVGTTTSSFTTNTTASGNDIEVTATAGGTATNWITKPFRADVTIDGVVYVNMWGNESAAGANASFGIRLAEYTTSEQTAFLDVDDAVELTTTAALRNQITTAPTSTLIDAGNRLVIDMRIIPVGTMGAGETAVLVFESNDDDESGDSFIMLQEQVRVNEVQRGGGTTINMRSRSVGAYQQIIGDLNGLLGVIVNQNEELRNLIDDLEYERDNN